jgi:D-alanyl-lipoteichoic acid acyltransferase DltB (MBOAT superfamily)
MAWDYRFIILILFSTLVDYVAGLKIFRANNPKDKKLWLTISMSSNLGLLFLFKYSDFTIHNFNQLLSYFSFTDENISQLGWVLPVGISFYTFQSMSYTIDIYRGILEPTNSFKRFMLYVAFFPQLVAGPIVKAREFLPQLGQPYHWCQQRFGRGLFFILFGLSKKVIIADSLAFYCVDRVYSSISTSSSLELWLAMYAYAFQIFCDFSGYSDIAIGCALLFGYTLPFNFNSPYIATNPQDFWRRWHISLSTWLRDYLYISLGGSRGSKWFTMRNLLIVMILGGLWHGASWNFVIWGTIHGSALVIYHLYKDFFQKLKFPRWMCIILYFHFTCLTWIFFRCQSFEDSINYISGLVSMSSSQMPSIMVVCALLILGNLYHAFDIPRQTSISDWFSRQNVVLWSLSILFISVIFVLLGENVQSHKAFIYFQF